MEDFLRFGIGVLCISLSAGLLLSIYRTWNDFKIMSGVRQEELELLRRNTDLRERELNLAREREDREYKDEWDN